jgi:hypothetical protein
MIENVSRSMERGFFSTIWNKDAVDALVDTHFTENGEGGGSKNEKDVSDHFLRHQKRSNDWVT